MGPENDTRNNWTYFYDDIHSGLRSLKYHLEYSQSNIIYLLSGDVVYEINGCSVTNEDTWQRCILKLNRQDQGFCVPKFKARAPSPATIPPFVDDDGEMKCCSSNTTSSHLCFYFRFVLWIIIYGEEISRSVKFEKSSRLISDKWLQFF